MKMTYNNSGDEMEREFKKEENVVDAKTTNRYQDLMNHIEKIKQTLKSDYNNMQYIEDESLLDYYTYKIKSDQAQYDYLIKQAKKMETGTFL